MAQVEDSKGSKSVAVDVNIVPFIDLMSVLIIFLLITAVWSQVSMIQIGSSVYGQQTEEPVEAPPNAEVPLRIDIKANGYRLVVGQKQVPIGKSRGEYNQDRLLDELRKVKEQYPEKVDAVVSMSDSLKYEYLINGMDTILLAGFPQISIATGGVK